jgi:hypothetical protein
LLDEIKRIKQAYVMKTIEANIERAKDGTYSVYCINEMFSGMGNTAETAKLDMRQQMEFFRKTAIEDNFSYPDFLDENFEIVYKFDTESLLEYYSGILSLSGLEKITGIHQKQLWNYLHRKSKPRRAQVEKIEKGLHALGSELIAISL